MTTTQAQQLQDLHDKICSGAGELKRISLPASKSVDVTSYTTKWRELNTSNFSVEIKVAAKASITAAHQYAKTATTTLNAPVLSYNNTTGILTVTTSAVTKTEQCYSDNNAATSKLTATATPTVTAVYMYVIE